MASKHAFPAFLSLLAIVLVVSCAREWSRITSPSGNLQKYARGVATRLIHDPVSDDEVRRYAAMSSDTLTAIVDAGLEMVDVPVAERASVRRALIESPSSKATPNSTESSCKQYLEMKDGTNGKRSPYDVRNDQWCDGESDMDYMFLFNPAFAYNPDRLRWYARSGWVRFVFLHAYGAELLGCSLCTSPVSLILGTNGVAAAGGVGNVREELYIWQE